MPPSRSITLCLTLGDPLGIGPEITAKLLGWHLSHYRDVRFVVIGAMEALIAAARRLNIVLPPGDGTQVTYVDINGSLPGEIAYNAIEKAVDTIIQGKADALVTGPIAKHHLQDAGIVAQGHTEILEILARKHFPQQKHRADMVFVAGSFRLMLLTRHIPLHQVQTTLMALDLKQPMGTLTRFLQTQAGIATPRIALLGVNPHAGEVGGMEEPLLLSPFITAFNEDYRGIATIEGPFAADAFFRDFEQHRFTFDAVVATYHDQGLIPFKLLAGYKAVNVTIGLPFIRTSVGHGTAMDIAGMGIAKEDSLIEAINTAVQLVQVRQTQPV